MEFIASGAWTLLAGEAGLKNGAIIRYEDRERALAWYDSPSCQSATEGRNACRNVPIGTWSVVRQMGAGGLSQRRYIAHILLRCFVTYADIGARMISSVRI